MHLGIVVLLIGVFVSAGAKSTTTLTDVELGTSVEGLGVRFEIGNFTVSSSQSNVYSEQVDDVVSEYSSVSSDVTIQYLGKTYQKSLHASFYPNYGLAIRPLIITTETGDVYLHFDYSDAMYESLTQVFMGNTIVPENVNVTVQTSPLIYLVWAGIALMVVSISLQAAADLAKKGVEEIN
jgi:cytochrome c biogenesis factor